MATATATATGAGGVYTDPNTGDTRIRGTAAVDTLAFRTSPGAAPDPATTSNASWLPALSAQQWTLIAADAVDRPAFVLPAGSTFAYSEQNGLYRWAGTDAVYNLRVTGTLTATAENPATTTNNYDLRLPTAIPVNLAAYAPAAPTDPPPILGELWLSTVYPDPAIPAASRTSNIFKAYAKTLPATTGNTSNVRLRILAGTADETFATLLANTRVTLEGTLVYSTTGFNPLAAVATTVQTPLFTQDVYGRVAVNPIATDLQTTAAPPVNGAILDVYETTSGAAPLVLRQYATPENPTPTADVFQVRASGGAGRSKESPPALVVSATGNVGLGTTAPTARLHVAADAATFRTTSGWSYSHTWVSRVTPANNLWRGVTWSPELNLFVAVSYTGTGDRIMTSGDGGVTWVSRANPVENNWYTVTWAGAPISRFVAVAASGSGNRVMTSDNGTTWTTRATNDNDWADVVWARELGLFVAVASASSVVGTRVMTSPDGITWTTRATPAAAEVQWRGLIWAPEISLFVAVANQTTVPCVMTSPDGVTWTTRTSPANAWLSVTWAATLGLFAAVGITGTGNLVMTSADGVTWVTRASAANNQWIDVTWAGEIGQFIAVGQTGTGTRIMTSANGVTWVTRAYPVDRSWRSIVWAPEIGTLVVVGETNSGAGAMTSQSLPNYLSVRNGNVGIGRIPGGTAQLDLTTDDARKLTTTSWLTGSDARLKTDIVAADDALCSDVVAALPLRRFAWNPALPAFAPGGPLHDRNVLGWIADEVAQYFPKSLQTLPSDPVAYGPDLRDIQLLDHSQIYATMYGATRHLIAANNALRARIAALTASIAAAEADP